MHNILIDHRYIAVHWIFFFLNYKIDLFREWFGGFNRIDELIEGLGLRNDVYLQSFYKWGMFVK